MRAWLILPLVLQSACGPSPDQEAADGRQRAGSWAASIAAAVDDWSRDLVPSHYVYSTLDAAAKDLTEQASQLRADAGDAAAVPLETVARAVPRIEQAVARGDREHASEAAAALTRAVPEPPTPPSVRDVSR